jgi:hypothetical protein
MNSPCTPMFSYKKENPLAVQLPIVEDNQASHNFGTKNPPFLTVAYLLVCSF